VADIVIVGVGNPYRCDDAAGWAVIEGLSGKVDNSIKLLKLRGDIAEILDLFTQYETVYLVDACLMKEGSWKRLDLLDTEITDENPVTSTHGFSVSEAVALAKALEQLPKKLILYAISGTAFQIGDKLTPSAAKSVKAVTDAILQEEDIRACMNRVS
jgi:hydrogenase maturation protease